LIFHRVFYIKLEDEGVMGRKLVAASTIISFMVFSYSCYATSRIKVNSKTEEKFKGKKVKIVKLQKDTGEYIKFPKGQTAFFSEGYIVGALIEREYSLKKTALKKIEKDNKGNITNITTKDGRNFEVMEAREDGDRVIFNASDFARISLSEVDVVWVKKINTLLTIGFVWLLLAPLTWLAMSGGNWLSFSF
jgi:hypothetical protein